MPIAKTARKPAATKRSPTNMQTAAINTTVPTTAAQQPQPAPKPPLQRYEQTITGKFIRLLGRASNKQIQFLENFIDECNRGIYDADEAAFIFGNRAMGFEFLTDPEQDKPLAEDLRQAFRILYGRPENDMLRRAFTGILHSYREFGEQMRVENMLFYVEASIQEQDVVIEAARDAIRSCPEALRDDIQKIVREHPEILQGVTAAK